MFIDSFSRVLKGTMSKEIVIVGAGKYGRELAGALIDSGEAGRRVQHRGGMEGIPPEPVGRFLSILPEKSVPESCGEMAP